MPDAGSNPNDRPDAAFSAADRLDSWKEIASYLQRSVRTVQRWEQDEELPVRRLHHQKQGSVYAFRPELDAWLRSRERPDDRMGHDGTDAPAPARRDAATGSAVGEPVIDPSIAVLPFADLGPDDDEYFADGVTEELLNALARVDGLRVASRTSSFRFKGISLESREIARQLGVRTVLEGSVRRAGDRVRVTAQLIDATADDHLWAESYDREVEDIFAIQDEIAATIVERLRERLSEHLGLEIRPHPTASLSAYQAYLKGRHHWNDRTLAGFEAAIGFFEEAIGHDPDYALAFAGLADAHNMLAYHGHRDPTEAFPEAERAARRALEIDDELAEAHASLAFTKMFHDHDWSGARGGFERALELHPDYPIARYWYGLNLGARGRFFEAIAEVRRARELDPASPLINTYVAGAYYFGRQYEAAVERCRDVLEIDPDFFLAHLMMGWSLRGQEEHEEAIAALEEALEISPESADAAAHLAHTYAVAGEHDEARSILADLRERARRDYVSPGHLALVHTGLGTRPGGPGTRDRRKAIELLERAFEERYAWIVFLEVDPVFDPLREEEGFGALLSRLDGEP